MLMMGQRGIISRVDDSELVEVTIHDSSAQSNPQVYSICRNDVARSTTLCYNPNPNPNPIPKPKPHPKPKPKPN